MAQHDELKRTHSIQRPRGKVENQIEALKNSKNLEYRKVDEIQDLEIDLDIQMSAVNLNIHVKENTLDMIPDSLPRNLNSRMMTKSDDEDKAKLKIPVRP